VTHSSVLNNAPREALHAFAALLHKWNAALNLVSPADLENVWARHIADSLQLISLIPADANRGIDLGSGAGFPGLVVSLAHGLPFDLIEADQRKAAFLREAARVTKAPVQVHAARIEALELPPAPLVTARALAPLPRLLPLVFSKLAPSGIALLPKGAGYSAELTAARREWQMNVQSVPSRTAPGAVILRISELRHVPSAP
jgi:16S rRNA (guanine527-N7)-methyltransferase